MILVQRITVFKLTLNHRHIVTYIALCIIASSVLLDGFDIQCGFTVPVCSQSCHKIGPQVEVSASIIIINFKYSSSA